MSDDVNLSPDARREGYSPEETYERSLTPQIQARLARARVRLMMTVPLYFHMRAAHLARADLEKENKR